MKFQCQKTGKCCVAREGYGFVYLSIKDRLRLSRYLGLTLLEFRAKYCERTENRWHLKSGTCPFLQGHECGVYDGRPTQCRTWPYWRSNITNGKWNDNVSFCAGIGLGPEPSPDEVESKLKEQDDLEYQLALEAYCFESI